MIFQWKISNQDWQGGGLTLYLIYWRDWRVESGETGRVWHSTPGERSHRYWHWHWCITPAWRVALQRTSVRSSLHPTFIMQLKTLLFGHLLGSPSPGVCKYSVQVKLLLWCRKPFSRTGRAFWPCFIRLKLKLNLTTQNMRSASSTISPLPPYSGLNKQTNIGSIKNVYSIFSPE